MTMSRSERPSIHDVARIAGVSAATVSKYLHGVKTIKPTNMKNIREAIDALGYRLDPLAGDLRRERRNILGLVVPDLENEFFGAIACRMELLAEAAGYSLSIASSHESEERELRLIQRMDDWRVAGTILAPVRSERGLGAKKMVELGMDGVLLDRVESSDTHCTVSVDNSGASASVCRTLGEIGHCHVLIIGPSDVSKSARARLNGFRNEAAQSFPDMNIGVLVLDADADIFREELALYLKVEKPTAVFSLFQKGTLIAITAFRRLGLRCPEDINLIGFDDAEWMQVTEPSVSVVVQPVARLAETAFKTLLKILDTPNGTVKLHLEECQLVLRGSVSLPKTHQGRFAIEVEPKLHI
jgi:LacI family transcriptional regulator